MPIPGDGRSLLQPLWVEDLVTCLVWALQNPDTVDQTYDIGGGEYFTLRQVLEIADERLPHTRRIDRPSSTALYACPLRYARCIHPVFQHPNLLARLCCRKPYLPRGKPSTYYLDSCPRALPIVWIILSSKPFSQRIQEALRLSR